MRSTSQTSFKNAELPFRAYIRQKSSLLILNLLFFAMTLKLRRSRGVGVGYGDAILLTIRAGLKAKLSIVPGPIPIKCNLQCIMIQTEADAARAASIPIGWGTPVSNLFLHIFLSTNSHHPYLISEIPSFEENPRWEFPRKRFQRDRRE